MCMSVCLWVCLEARVCVWVCECECVSVWVSVCVCLSVLRGKRECVCVWVWMCVLCVCLWVCLETRESGCVSMWMWVSVCVCEFVRARAEARWLAALCSQPSRPVCPSCPSETQECLGAPVLRRPPAGQDECGGAAGAHEAAPEGAGPGAQEDAEPRREDGAALVPLPQPTAPGRPRLSMLGGSRQAGLGQGAELPRGPQSRARLTPERVVQRTPRGLCVRKPGHVSDLVRGCPELEKEWGCHGRSPGARGSVHGQVSESRAWGRGPSSAFWVSRLNPGLGKYRVGGVEEKDGATIWGVQVNQPPKPPSRCPGEQLSRVWCPTPLRARGLPQLEVRTGPAPQESQAACCPLVVLPGTAPCPQSP